MGVASNRTDVKVAAAQAERALEQLAEPLAALLQPADQWPGRQLDLAWLEVIRNSAHDSVCACSHDDVVAAVLHRYAEATHIAEGLVTRALRTLGRSLAMTGAAVVNPSARDPGRRGGAGPAGPRRGGRRPPGAQRDARRRGAARHRRRRLGHGRRAGDLLPARAGRGGAVHRRSRRRGPPPLRRPAAGRPAREHHRAAGRAHCSRPGAPAGQRARRGPRGAPPHGPGPGRRRARVRLAGLGPLRAVGGHAGDGHRPGADQRPRDRRRGPRRRHLLAQRPRRAGQARRRRRRRRHLQLVTAGPRRLRRPGRVGRRDAGRDGPGPRPAGGRRRVPAPAPHRGPDPGGLGRHRRPDGAGGAGRRGLRPGEHHHRQPGPGPPHAGRASRCPSPRTTRRPSAPSRSSTVASKPRAVPPNGP